MKKSKEQTAVISFRVPTDRAKDIDKQAKKAKKKRAKFVEHVFSAAFDTYILAQSERA